MYTKAKSSEQCRDFDYFPDVKNITFLFDVTFVIPSKVKYLKPQ